MDSPVTGGGRSATPTVGEVLGRTVTLAPETTVSHHDEGPVSLLTTASVRALSALSGGDVEPLRFRANLLVDVPGDGFPEDDWPGRRLRVGAAAVLRVVRPLTRCVMIDMAQGPAGERNDLLKTLARHHDLTLGVFATVERPGRVAVGDACAWEVDRDRDDGVGVAVEAAHHHEFTRELPQLLGPRGRLFVAREGNDVVGVGAVMICMELPLNSPHAAAR